MATLNDAIKVWQDADNKRFQEQEAQQAEILAQKETNTKEAFETIGLTPDRIQGQSAFFQFEGEEIQFVVSSWRYGMRGCYRVLGLCPRCQNNLFTDEHELTLENIGWMTYANPQKRFHECWIENEVIEPTPVIKTNAERLVEVLTDLIDEKISALN